MGVKELSTILIAVMVSQVFAYDKTHQMAYFKCVQLIMHQRASLKLSENVSERRHRDSAAHPRPCRRWQWGEKGAAAGGDGKWRELDFVFD